MKNEIIYSIQIVPNDDIHNFAEKRYPHLYKEVIAQDKVSNSSWYTLSEIAYKEYKLFRQAMKRRGIWILRRLKSDKLFKEANHG